MEQNIAGLVKQRLEQDKVALGNSWLNQRCDKDAPTGGQPGAPVGLADQPGQAGQIATRYLIIDNLLPDQLARQVYNAFPLSPGQWHMRSSFRERKRTLTAIRRLEPIVQQATEAFHDPDVLALVSDITGIAPLHADPSLYAAGISMMSPGDFLNPHIDNSHDGQRRRYRRLNLLYYVSPDWTSDMGGNLELWDKAVTSRVSIEARFNRLVVMETNSCSWHSVDPIRSHDQNRCCLSNYYFSASAPGGTDYHHVTSFLGRPDQPVRRMLGHADNACRQLVSSLTGAGRGRKLLNQPD